MGYMEKGSMEKGSAFVFMMGGAVFLMGLALGVSAGLLMAPRPGSDTRKQLKEMTDETGRRMSRMTEEAKQAVIGVIDRKRNPGHEAT